MNQNWFVCGEKLKIIADAIFNDINLTVKYDNGDLGKYPFKSQAQISREKLKKLPYYYGKRRY